VGAKGNDHLHLPGPASQDTVRRLQQQGQWASPGAVRHYQTDTLAVEISRDESGADEAADRIRRKSLTDAADGGRTCWVTRICPVVLFRSGVKFARRGHKVTLPRGTSRHKEPIANFGNNGNHSGCAPRRLQPTGSG
jgi:hypothetical protein